MNINIIIININNYNMNNTNIYNINDYNINVHYNYNINKVLEKYHYLDKSSVLQWISIVSGIPCHFAWIMLEKDNNNNIIRRWNYDNFRYDYQKDPELFDIDTVIQTPGSAAAQAIMTGKPANKKSIINGKDEYYCNAYYEANQVQFYGTKELAPNRFDSLLVLGWEKVVYDTIQQLAKLYSAKARRI